MISILVLLDDITNVTLHNRRRGNGEGWGWYSHGSSDNLKFRVTTVPGSEDPVVTVSVSGPVDLEAGHGGTRLMSVPLGLN